MIPQLPPELWATIYGHFVNTATTRSELIPCMLVNWLAYDIICPRLFETFISHPSFTTPAKLFFELPQAVQKSCIKRFYIDHGRDILLHQFELGQVMEQAGDGIERLYYIAPPESGLDFLVASLKNLTFLQISLLQFAVFQYDAYKIPLLWAGSLNKLYLDLGRKGPDDKTERIRLGRLSNAMNMLDLCMFPQLTQVFFIGTDILATVEEAIPRLLSESLPRQLFIIIDVAQMKWYSSYLDMDLIYPNIGQND